MNIFTSNINYFKGLEVTKRDFEKKKNKSWQLKEHWEEGRIGDPRNNEREEKWKDKREENLR